MTFAHTTSKPKPAEPLVRIAIAWAVGLLLGSQFDLPLTWPITTTLAAGLTITSLLSKRPPNISLLLATLTITLAAATYWQITHTIASNHIARYATETPRLVDMTGNLTAPPRFHTPPPDAPAYRKPATTFTLQVDTLHTPAGNFNTTGPVSILLPHIDQRIADHQRIRIQGFLRPLQYPANPGQTDYTTYKVSQGIYASCTLDNPGAWQPAPTQPHTARLTQARSQWTDRLHTALHAGNPSTANPKAVALLDAILLGQRSSDLTETYDAFKRTGIAHLLAISGLHVGVIALGAWCVASILIPRPRWALLIAGTVVGLYLLAIPWRVPIIRSGFIAIAYCLFSAIGRRPSPRSLLALIGLTLLIIRPDDLFRPGFQLSFGIVASLLCFTTPVSNFLWPVRISLDQHTLRTRCQRAFANYLAVSIVAFLTALPIIAYHFQMISPLAIAMSVLTFPLVVVILWLGLAKLILSVIIPPLGSLLATPLLALSGFFVTVVEAADRLGTAIDLPKPSALWAVATLAIFIALFLGRFRRRRLALTACLLVSITWLYAPSLPLFKPAPPALSVRMLSVGAGSCYVIQSGNQTWMFDCGSSSYPDITPRTVAPALDALGIQHIHTLVISHADTDHYSGVTDLIEHIPIDRVITTEHLLRNDARATQRLLTALQQNNIPIQTIAAGWQASLPHASVAAIWPPPQAHYKEDNDTSIVLSFTTNQRRLLLTGDIQTQAMTDMLNANLNLHADITDLPHHGAFPPPALDWLRAASPSIVLQSCNPKRLQYDPWHPHLTDIQRHTTPRHGTVTVQISHTGHITVSNFRKPLIVD